MSVKIILLIGHIIGVALGAGGATLSDVLFLTSVRDNFIDRSELRLLRAASRVVLVGLALLVVTGVGFFFTDSQPSQRFWAKLTIVGIAALNGFWMHQRFFPFFARRALQQRPLLSAKTKKQAWQVVSAGCISAVSWYAALILGVWQSLSLSYWEIIAIYLLILLAALLISNLTFHLYLRWQRAQAVTPMAVAEAMSVPRHQP